MRRSKSFGVDLMAKKILVQDMYHQPLEKKITCCWCLRRFPFTWRLFSRYNGISRFSNLVSHCSWACWNASIFFLSCSRCRATKCSSTLSKLLSTCPTRSSIWVINHLRFGRSDKKWLERSKELFTDRNQGLQQQVSFTITRRKGKQKPIKSSSS